MHGAVKNKVSCIEKFMFLNTTVTQQRIIAVSLLCCFSIFLKRRQSFHWKPTQFICVIDADHISHFSNSIASSYYSFYSNWGSLSLSEEAAIKNF